jgi:lipoprotein-releasing system permease protein
VSIIKTLKQDKRIIDVAAKVTASVLFNSGTIEISGFINGIDIVAEDKLFKISDYIRRKSDRPKSEQQYYYRKGLSDKMLLIKEIL